MIQQITFILVVTATAFILYRRIDFLSGAIGLGRPVKLNDQPRKRWKRVFLLALGQKKMFKRIIPAFFHLIIYLGFIIINIEVLEFTIDGFTGSHRVFARAMAPPDGIGYAYTLIMNVFEGFALGVILACIIFLIRRNVLKLRRFRGIEMGSWPLTDANLILVFEIVLMIAILTMNAADQLLQLQQVDPYISTGTLIFSRSLIFPLIDGLSRQDLILLERVAWWFHIIGILGFAVYITYSKHLHIILAFPNTFYSSLNPPAMIPGMEVVTREVKMMLGLRDGTQEEVQGEANEKFGASDVTDLTWKNIMDAFTCTECGRCTAVCPANLTGKKLSPRKILMDTRDRAEFLMTAKRKKLPAEDSKNLFSLISREEIFACTTCSACIEACPVGIDPVSIIVQMRRYTTMEESTAPPEWNLMFGNIENNFAPWKFPSADRFKWAEKIRK